MADGGVRTVRARNWMVALALAVLGAGCTPMDDLMVAVFGRSMRDQPSIGAYENPRPPPTGSVPFASGNFPAAAGDVALGQAEGAEMPPRVERLQLLLEEPVAVDLANPVPATPESLARGEAVFKRACLPCHGPTGQGDGPVTAAGMPSFSLHTPDALGRGEGYIYTIIRIGRGSMPAYGHQITHFDRWHVVNYVLQLQGRLSPQGAAPEPAGRDD